MAFPTFCARRWQAGQVFAFIPKGEGMLLVPVPKVHELAGVALTDPDADLLPAGNSNRGAGGHALPGVEVEGRRGEETERGSAAERRTCIARPVHTAGPNRGRRAHRRPGLQPVLERTVRKVVGRARRGKRERGNDNDCGK